mgnify:CR=1 FL=1
MTEKCAANKLGPATVAAARPLPDDLTARFDRLGLTPETLAFTPAEIDAALLQTPEYPSCAELQQQANQRANAIQRGAGGRLRR